MRLLETRLRRTRSLWQETAGEVNIQQQQLLVPHSSLGLMNATVSKPWMRIDELPKRQSSLYGGIKPNTWPPPYLTEAHIQRLTDLMEKDHLEIEQAVEVLGIECAWASRNLTHRFKAPPPQPVPSKKVPPMMTKFLEGIILALLEIAQKL